MKVCRVETFAILKNRRAVAELASGLPIDAYVVPLGPIPEKSAPWLVAHLVPEAACTAATRICALLN